MNEEKLKNYINEKIAKYVGNTIVLKWKAVDTANTLKANYWCGYIKALKDLKDFLGIKEDE